MNSRLETQPPDPTLLTDGYAKVYERIGSRLHCLAVAYTRNPASAEDLVQEAFLRVWRRRATLSRPGELEGYLYQTVRNLARNHLRRSEVAGRVLERQALVTPRESTDSQGLDAEQVNSALGSLSVEQREVVLLRIYEGLAFREISRLIEVPLGTVHSRFRVALERLRPLLEETHD